MKIKRNSWLFSSLLLLVLILVAYELVRFFSNIPEYLFPSIFSVVSTAWGNFDLIFSATIYTFSTSMLGFSLALVFGTIFGMLLSWSSETKLLVVPFLSALNATPKIIFLPIFMVWVGIGYKLEVLLAFFLAVFPILTSMSSPDRSKYLDETIYLRAYGANAAQIFLYVELPSMIKTLVSTSKISVSLAFVGSIISEIVAGSSGIGYLSIHAQGLLDIPMVFACVVFLMMVAGCSVLTIEQLERRFIYW